MMQNSSSGTESAIAYEGVTGSVADALGAARRRHPGGWYAALVGLYLKRNFAKRARGESKIASGAHPTERAHRAIRWACAKSAFTGALSGTASTAAAVVTAETKGVGGLVAIPLAVVAMGGEMLVHSMIDVDLTCELAEIFGLEFDPAEADDLWRLYALAFGTHEHRDESTDPGRDLVQRVSRIEGEEVGKSIGRIVLGEAVVRNIVPIIGIVSSAVVNVVRTRNLGHTVRRYMRYHRAFRAAFAHACELLDGELDLLIEGLWFIFSADGKLSPEEAAFLANMVRKLDPASRASVTRRFTDDDFDWNERMKAHIPAHLRESFLHALEIAAAVDKEVSLPERQILRRAARSLGVTFDAARVNQMIEQFEARGVLDEV